jgi:hypothetical protein
MRLALLGIVPVLAYCCTELVSRLAGEIRVTLLCVGRGSREKLALEPTGQSESQSCGAVL